MIVVIKGNCIDDQVLKHFVPDYLAGILIRIGVPAFAVTAEAQVISGVACHWCRDRILSEERGSNYQDQEENFNFDFHL